MKNVWAYDPEKCDGDYCPLDCDKCAKADEIIKEQEEKEKGGERID